VRDTPSETDAEGQVCFGGPVEAGFAVGGIVAHGVLLCFVVLWSSAEWWVVVDGKLDISDYGD
jgi:hypothetical protein